MKPFPEALRDGFRKVVELPQFLAHYYQKEGMNEVPMDGFHVFAFGDHREFELRVEPFGEDENEFAIGVYKNNVLLTERLIVWRKKPKEQK